MGAAEQLGPLAARLAAMRLSGEAIDLSPDERPGDEAAAYRLQGRVNGLLAERLGPVAGHKIGCTTPVMRAFLGIDNPAAGEVFASTVAQGQTTIRARDYRRVGIECEVAVRIGRPVLPGAWDRPAADAVGGVMAGIEIVDDRYAGYARLGTPTLIADNFFNAGCVLGEPVNAWRALDLTALEGRTIINGEERGRGTGSMVMGHPVKALEWLIGQRLARGEGLAEGAFVMLGSLVETRWLAAGDQALIVINGLGELSVAVDE